MIPRQIKSLFLLSFLLLTACSRLPTNPPAGNSPVIKPNTEVIGGVGDTRTFEVQGDTLVFSDPAKAASIESGDVLVSAEGDGLLRKAVGVRQVGSTVEVDTTSAALVDAVEAGSVSTTLNLGQSPDGQSLGMQNAEVRPQLFQPIRQDLSAVLIDETVSDPGFGSVQLKVEITDGEMSFTPDLDLDLVIQGGRVDLFKLVARGTLSLSATVLAEASGELIWSGSKFVKPPGKDHLYRKAFVQWISYVPVVEVVTIDLEVGFKTNFDGQTQFTAGGGAIASLEIGAEFSNGNWHEISNPGFQTFFTQPAVTYQIKGFGRVYAKPILSVELYGVAGPTIGLEGGPRLAIDSTLDPWWTLYADLDSTAQFNASILDFNLSSPPYHLIDKTWVLAQAGGGAPNPISVIISPNSVVLGIGQSQQFTASVFGTSNTSVTWSASCGTVTDNGNYTAPNSGGTCSVTATSQADPSKSDTATVTVIEALGKVTVSVKDAVTDQPVSGVAFLTCPNDTNCRSALGVDENPTGTYTTTLPTGSYTLVLQKSGYLDAIIREITVRENETTILESVLYIEGTRNIPGDASGKIANALTGGGVEGARLDLRKGLNTSIGTIVTTGLTDAGGVYSFTDLDAGHYTAEVSRAGYITTHFNITVVGGLANDNQNATISPDLPNDQWRIVLTWGQSPSDLDSHLTGPLADGTTDRFHVYFSQKNYTFNSFTYANLDVDDITSFGPETITIFQLTGGDGVYRYSVHDYTDRHSSLSTALANSGAQIKLYQGSILLRTFNVPNQDGTLWKVFELDFTRADPVVPINTMTYESSPGAVDGIPPISSAEPSQDFKLQGK